MVERFEARLQRMFSDPPYYSDQDAFASRVQGRLQRGQTTRGLLIGGAGLVGGLVAVGQLLNTNLGAAVQSAGGELTPVGEGLSRPLQDARLAGLLDQAAAYLPSSSTGMEVAWMAAALAIAGLALLATRMFGEV